jgi:thymidylate synthase (FAD)
MPQTREINIFQIASTKVNREAVQRWLASLGANKWEFPDPSAVSDPALVIALAAKRCYMSFEAGLNPNVTQVRKDYVEYFDNILASGHGSVLEHAVYTYAIENVSRVFTAEMNRHRAGWAISEGSLRFIRFDKDVPYWLPLSLRDEPGDDEDLRTRKRNSRTIFNEAFKSQEDCYRTLLEIWDMNEGDHNFAYKKRVTSCLRRIIGMGVCTGGVWTGNVRALRHVLAMRCSAAAEEEICHVFSRIAWDIAKNEPLMFGDFSLDENGFWGPKYNKV